MKVVEYLSDGKRIRVRTLGLFELDPIAPQDSPGDFMEEMDIGGKIVLKKYIPPEIPPEEPKVPFSEARVGGQLWHSWEEYRLWLGFLAHRRTEAEIISDYATRVKAYILSNCIKRKESKRIVDDEDWLKVHRAALSARLHEEDLAQALASTFQGQI